MAVNINRNNLTINAKLFSIEFFIFFNYKGNFILIVSYRAGNKYPINYEYVLLF